jgi:diguanylate cyclase (GGDEF)-like protein
LLVDHLRHGIAYSQRYKRMVATLVVNIDHFKYVNQSLGHTAGDDVLKLVANRLRGAVRDHDSIARLGADSFAMTLIDVENLGGAAQAMTRVLNAVRAPFMIGEHEIVVTCSVGCALYPTDGPDPETLLRHADTAMRHARNLGGDCHYFYSADGDRGTEERLYLEANLRRAIENGELLINYQPQVSAADGRFIGMEALVRWKHPEMGMVSPGRFIPVAEETDLIVSIGGWVMEEACRQTRQLLEDGFEVSHVAVNLSPRQFRDKQLLAKIEGILARTGLPAKYLELEITESLAMKDVDAVVAKLKELKALGLQLAIDDFGTGYSSLSYLRRFPIDRLKIDQSFTREVTSSNDGAAIARAVIQLGHALDLRVIAEGVETESQLSFLRDNECDEIQGYYYSRPLAMADLRKLLSAGASDAAPDRQTGAGVWLKPA